MVLGTYWRTVPWNVFWSGLEVAGKCLGGFIEEVFDWFSAFAFSSVSQAALTNCVAPGPTVEASVISGGVVSGDVTFTCAASGVALDGIFIDGLYLQLSGAFSDANATPALGPYSLNVSVLANTANGGLPILNGLNCTAAGTSVAVGVSGICSSNSGFIGITPLDTLSSFTVTIHATSPALVGERIPFSGSTSLSFDVRTTQDTGGSSVPEPASYALMGGGLISLSLAVRKRKARA